MRPRGSSPLLGYLFLFTLPFLVTAQPYLGEAPPASADVSHLPRGPLTQGLNGGFSVDANSREAVRDFYNAVYGTSDNVPMLSSSDIASCFAGTNSTGYLEAALRRINWFRALAGVPAAITLNTTYNAKDQQAAVMMSANTNVSHSPPLSWKCYTSQGAEAAQNSNVAVGVTGADAITYYIWDYGPENSSVGHRRWLLYPQTRVMGMGDVPMQGTYYPANANWVKDGNYLDQRPTTRTPFVAWPPAGYVPYQVVFPRWSFSYKNAGFSGASVTMTSNGVPILVTIPAQFGSFGESTLAWTPMGLDGALISTQFPFSGTDTVYTVTISNIVGMPQSSYTYSVTVFDPAKPGPNYLPTKVSGPSQPYVNLTNHYRCTAASDADSYEWRTAQRVATNFFDGAEGGLGNFTVMTSAGYDVITNRPSPPGGNFLFHLAQSSQFEDQLLQLDWLLLLSTNSQLQFRSRLARATSAQFAKVQISMNDGAAWQDLYSQLGSDGTGESSFALRTLSLSHYAGRTVRLRFMYHFQGFGNFEPGTDDATGWFLDDLVVTNVQRLVRPVITATSTNQFSFLPSEPGAFLVQASKVISGEFPVEWSPALDVSPTTNTPPVILLGQPGVEGNQIQVNFTLQAGAASSFQLLQADQPSGPWVTNASATLTTNSPGSSFHFNAPVSGTIRFYRVQTP